jgi:hypothetical protein
MIAVGKLVARQFAPALGRGDREKLKAASSERLAARWAGFSGTELKRALAGEPDRMKRRPVVGQARPPKAKPPKIGLVSLRVKGDRAVLVARRGKERYRFDCVRQHGQWKVDEVQFPHRGRTTRLNALLDVLLAARALQTALETGSRPALAAASTDRFRRATWDRLTDEELTSVSRMLRPGPRRPGARPSAGSRIDAEVTDQGGRVLVKLGGLKLEIDLVPPRGPHRVDGVRILLGGQPHRLEDLLAYGMPALRLLRAADRVLQRSGAQPRPSDAELQTLLTELRGLVSSELGARAFGWITPATLRLLPWPAILRAVRPTRPASAAARPAPAGSADWMSPDAIQRLERVGDLLHLQLRLPGAVIAATLRSEGGEFRLHAVRVQQSGRDHEVGELLAALSTLARLTFMAWELQPRLLAGPAKDGRAALGELLGALRRASSRDLDARIWSRIPADLAARAPMSVVSGALRRALGPSRSRPSGPGVTPPRSAGRALPRVALRDLRQTADRIQIGVTVEDRPVDVILVREGAEWRLDDVLTPVLGRPRSGKLLLGLVVPASALALVLLSGDATPLDGAVTDGLRREVIEPLRRVLGPRFPELLGQLVSGGGKPAGEPVTKPTPPARPAPARAPAAELGALRLSDDDRVATVTIVLSGTGPVEVRLDRVADGSWRLADVTFPLAGQTLTLARTGPVFAPLVGFGVALLRADLAGLRAASSMGFNTGLWFKMTTGKLKGLVKRITGGGGSPPAARGKRPGGKPKAQRSDVPRLLSFRMRDQARWPWAQVEMEIGGRTLLAQVIRESGAWRVHDVSVRIGSLNLSLKALLSLL